MGLYVAQLRLKNNRRLSNISMDPSISIQKDTISSNIVDDPLYPPSSRSLLNLISYNGRRYLSTDGQNSAELSLSLPHKDSSA